MGDILPGGTADGAITRAVGQELRRVREHQGLTRAAVIERIPSDISQQTLANYEYGVRTCTIERLVELCRALGVSSAELLGIALQRARIESRDVRIDLHAVVRDRQVTLRPLRRWARNRLAEDPTGAGVVRMDRSLVEEMAAFFGFTRAEFVRQLIRFTPDHAPLRAQ